MTRNQFTPVVYQGEWNRWQNTCVIWYFGKVLRRHDIRELQEDLGRLALSSLGRLESHVMATLDALSALLYKIAVKNWHGRAIEETFAEYNSGSALLEKHTVESLGMAPSDRNVRIMVTMPSEAAKDPTLVRNFLDHGMNIMRINCAHDAVSGICPGTVHRQRRRYPVPEITGKLLRSKWAAVRKCIRVWAGLQKAYARGSEGCFFDWEWRWRECRECFAEVMPHR
jgi:hypothetical protein